MKQPRLAFSTCRSRSLSLSLTLILLATGFIRGEDGGEHAATAPEMAVRGLAARGHERRVDLSWQPGPGGQLPALDVHRAEAPEGPYRRVGTSIEGRRHYSDFTGVNGKTFHYRLTPAGQGLDSPGASPPVTGRPVAQSDDALLTSVQEATFRYFWDHAHPVSGLARERDRSGDTVTTGGSGFGMIAIVVAVERGFITREQAVERLLRTLTFLEEKATRYHGAWSHWLNGATGVTIPFASKNGVRADDGADIVETSFLVQGMLVVRQYFDRDDPRERDLRERADRLWRGVEWSWFLRFPEGKRLYWHWSPRHGWLMDHSIGGHFNECLITYLLALASPTHPIPPESYQEGWIGDEKTYLNGNTYYGIPLCCGWPYGGRLFFTHYSFLGFDPRAWRGPHCDYFENNRAVALIHRAYAIENPEGHVGYGPEVWGLTSCDTPDGYRGLDPHTRDNGTVAPTAAISSMPYTPRESLAALKHYYHELGDRLWGEYGFRDSFHLGRDWFAKTYLAIDQGPIIIMIENHRSGLPWKLFMSSPEIAPMLEKIGWSRKE